MLKRACLADRVWAALRRGVRTGTIKTTADAEALARPLLEQAAADGEVDPNNLDTILEFLMQLVELILANKA